MTVPMNPNKRYYKKQSTDLLVRPVWIVPQMTGLQRLRGQDFAVPTDSQQVGIRIRGKIAGVVFQGTAPAFANSPLATDPNRQIRSNPPRDDANSPAQQVQRGYWINAVGMWQAFSPAEKAEANELARDNPQTHPHYPAQSWNSGYNWWISLRIHQQLPNSKAQARWDTLSEKAKAFCVEICLVAGASPTGSPQ